MSRSHGEFFLLLSRILVQSSRLETEFDLRSYIIIGLTHNSFFIENSVRLSARNLRTSEL